MFNVFFIYSLMMPLCCKAALSTLPSFFFQAINSRYRFLHCMGGQTPTWIRDGQMARKKCFMEGRMEKKLMADIIFIKGEEGGWEVPKFNYEVFTYFFIVYKIL